MVDVHISRDSTTGPIQAQAFHAVQHLRLKRKAQNRDVEYRIVPQFLLDLREYRVDKRET
jgi:hypothetical protein